MCTEILIFTLDRDRKSIAAMDDLSKSYHANFCRLAYGGILDDLGEAPAPVQTSPETQAVSNKLIGIAKRYAASPSDHQEEKQFLKDICCTVLKDHMTYGC